MVEKGIAWTELWSGTVYFTVKVTLYGRKPNRGIWWLVFGGDELFPFFVYDLDPLIPFTLSLIHLTERTSIQQELDKYVVWTRDVEIFFFFPKT